MSTTDTLSAAELDAAARKDLSGSDFAVPETRQLPIQDEAHVRAALSRFNQTHFPDEAAKKAAAKKIRAKAKSLGIDVADDSAVGKAAMAESSDVAHTHAKAGGGTYSHTHAVGSGKHGHSVGTDGNPTNGALLPTVAAMAENDAAVVSLRFAERTKLAQGVPVDYLCTGQWTFPKLNNGKPISVTRDDLATIKELFDQNAYGQNLPIVDEHHDPNRAVGWIESIDWHPSDPERLVATPKWNAGAETLVDDGAYAYTSPVLLLNWQNPVTGQVHPVVPGGLGLDPADPDGDRSGLALTNHPKIKRLSARFVAAEAGGKAQATVLALSEHGAVHTGTPTECVRVLLADPMVDDPEDDDGPVPECVNQPPYGRCPGFTKWPGDTDGDGTCLMATRDCNGYRAVPDDASTTSIYPFSEDHSMADDKAKTTAAPPATPPPNEAADIGEMQRLLAAETEARQKTETELARLGEVLKTRDEDAKIAAVTVRLSEIAKRFPPAVLASLTGAEKPDRTQLLELAEHPQGLAALEAVPVPKPSTQDRTGRSAFSLVELGTGADADPESAHGQLARAAEEIRKADPKLSREQAMLRASEMHPELAHAHYGERKRSATAG